MPTPQLQTNITTDSIMMTFVQPLGSCDVTVFHRKTGVLQWPVLAELQTERPLSTHQELQWFAHVWVERVRTENPDSLQILATVAE